ncbi:hypothetical protein CANINC_001087 [Pichia inconspicua]|uniref:Uncharacterized protein n=1 Tax=Pichia inconspicua TaxID=52247 RepID=A0A4T0X512_9ASCO|nr:hypothetical protein CANINC_001087 [[Candida] inconspicua]
MMNLNNNIEDSNGNITDSASHSNDVYMALFRFLYQANSDATNISHENGVETSGSQDTSGQSFDHLQEAQLARPLLNNSINNDSLTSMKLAAGNGEIVASKTPLSHQTNQIVSKYSV